MLQTDRRQTDRQTDKVHSYTLQLYEGGLKSNSVYVNLKELPKSILRGTIFKGVDTVQLDTKAGCVMG